MSPSLAAEREPSLCVVVREVMHTRRGHMGELEQLLWVGAPGTACTNHLERISMLLPRPGSVVPHSPVCGGSLLTFTLFDAA